MKKTVLFTAMLMAAALQMLYAQTPATFGYQGYLRDGSGSPVTGTELLIFRLYETSIGGSEVWSESLSVEVDHGVFSVVLGDREALPFPFDRPYWLGITVEGGEELAPRLPLTAVPYSIGAKALADSTVTTASIVDEAVTMEKLAPGIAAAPAGPAGGDLAGAYPAPLVSSLQNHAVSTAPPSLGDVMKWNGSAWAAMAPALPRGVIAIWADSLHLIPDGWALCDGTNGTPNLMNVSGEETYLRGVESTGTPGSSGGGGNLPTHSHTFNVGPFQTNPTSGHSSGWEVGGYLFVKYQHTHTVQITGTFPDSQRPRPAPPFYRAAFIMKR